MLVEDHRTTLPARRRQPKVERRLAAILAADILGYSTLMGRNEEETHRLVGADLNRVAKDIERFRGRIFSFAGDGIVAEFQSAVEALKCAIRIQNDAARRNARLPPERHINYRIGINTGEIIIEGDRTGGNAVIIAARLEQLAKPAGICLAAAVYDQVRNIIAANYSSLGEYKLKNVRDVVQVYELSPPTSGQSARHSIIHSDKSADGADHADYRASLAVLPFRTLQKSQSDSYFAAGIVDDVIRVLGGLKHLIVVSRSSTIGYGGGPPDLRRVGRDLDVRYVLHGSVRRAAKDIRIAVELDDATTQQTIWADRFEGKISEIFDLQESIAIRTAGSIAPFVRERELNRMRFKNQNTLTAYDLMLRALESMYHRDATALDKAQDYLAQAIALDPEYSAPRSHLAYLHILRLAHGWSRDEHAERVAALTTARRAVECDPNDALGLAIEGQLTGYLEKDHTTALRLLDRAVSLSPSCAVGWTFGSFTTGIMGNVEDALERARKAIRLAPIGPEAGPWHEHALSQAHYMAGNFEDAIIWGRLAAKHGAQASNLRCLAASLVAAGRIEEARRIARQMMATNAAFRLSTFRAYTPLKGETADLFVARLREAGLPD